MQNKYPGNRSGFGYVTISHKGVRIPTSVGSTQYENTFGGSGSSRSFKGLSGKIPAGYEHRPDLISNLYLDTPAAWWIVCERNSAFDVFEALNTGDPIRIPISL